MYGPTVRSIDIDRAAFHIGLANLVYNFCRYSILQQKDLPEG